VDVPEQQPATCRCGEPYVVSLLLLTPALAMGTLRETMHPTSEISWRPRRLHLPPESRQVFAGAASSAIAAFAVLGLLAVPTGTVLRTIDHGSGPALTGLVVFLGFATAAGAQVGPAFRSGLTTLVGACPPKLTGQVVSSYHAAAYIGLSVPVVGTGLVLTPPYGTHGPNVLP
jgi:hypothetical protein